MPPDVPRFHFDFHDTDGALRDGVGCEFDTFELAYLDAYRSMVRIGADLILEQRDPSSQRIEILDENRLPLATLSFDEVFRRRPRRSAAVSYTPLAALIEDSRRLGAEIKLACVDARASVADARRTLERADAACLRAAQGW